METQCDRFMNKVLYHFYQYFVDYSGIAEVQGYWSEPGHISHAFWCGRYVRSSVPGGGQLLFAQMLIE